MRRYLPRLRLDPGWLLVSAGLALCAAAILVPAREDLEALQRQAARLAGLEAHAEARLAARYEFLEQLERGEEALLRRLAAAQLNLAPADGTPLLAAASRDAPVSEWIDQTVPPPPMPSPRSPPSLLSRLSGGRGRPWLVAGAALSMFAGLLVGIGPARRRGDRPGPTRPTVGASRLATRIPSAAVRKRPRP